LTNPGKQRLRELDGILDVLERLNLNDAVDVPSWLADRLAGFGIVACRPISELIDSVFECQAAFVPRFTEPKRRSPWRKRWAQLATSGSMGLEGNAAIVDGRDLRKRALARTRWVRWHRVHGEARNQARRVARA
jgi:hypothetical protein